VPCWRCCIVGEVVADARLGQWTLRSEHHFDRLWPEKLVQAYAVLVPEEVRAVGSARVLPPTPKQEAINGQSSRYLCARVV
jgi:hypothetical protein